jgi:uncharacterized protein YlxP (DUF503 family)
MVVGIASVTFRLHDCRSLKAKRKIVKSIIARTRNRFNVAAAETGMNDHHQSAQIGLATVGNDRSYVNAKLDKMLNLIESLGLAEVVATDLEIFNT